MIRAIVFIAILSLAIQDAVAQASKYPWLYSKSNTSTVKKTPNTTSYRRTTKPTATTRKPWLPVINRNTTAGAVVYSKPAPTTSTVNRSLPWNQPQPAAPSRSSSSYYKAPPTTTYNNNAYNNNQDITYVEEATPLKAYPWNTPVAPSKTYTSPKPINTQQTTPIYNSRPTVRKAAPMPPPPSVRKAAPMPVPNNIRKAVPMPAPSTIRKAVPMPPPRNARRAAPMPPPTRAQKTAPIVPKVQPTIPVPAPIMPSYNNNDPSVKVARVAPMPPPPSKKEKRRNKRNRWKSKKNRKATTPIAIITVPPPPNEPKPNTTYAPPPQPVMPPPPAQEHYANPNTYTPPQPVVQQNPAVNNDPIFAPPPPPPPAEPIVQQERNNYNPMPAPQPPMMEQPSFDNNNFNLPPPPTADVPDNSTVSDDEFAPPPPSSVVEDAPNFSIEGGSAKIIEENGERIVVIGGAEEEEFQPLPKDVLEERMSYFYDGDWKSLNKKAKKEQKRFFVDFMTDWCRVCKKMEHTTYSDLTVQANVAKNNFIAYQLNAEEEAYVANKYNVTAFPALLFFDEEGKKIGRLDGFVSKTNFLKALEDFRPEIPHTQYTEFR